VTGSGSDFRKRPDPGPELHKFLANFFPEILLLKICSKKYCTYVHDPKSKIEIPEVFMAFTHTNKVKIRSFLKARIRIRSQTSGSDQKGQYSTGSATLTVGLEPEPHKFFTRNRRRIKMMRLRNTDFLPFHSWLTRIALERPLKILDLILVVQKYIPLHILSNSDPTIEVMTLAVVVTLCLPLFQCCGSGSGPFWSDPDV
jgi:hypothetical protein